MEHADIMIIRLFPCRGRAGSTMAADPQSALSSPGKRDAATTGPGHGGNGYQAAASRSRPCGAVRSIAGPTGTTPVGLIVSWLA